MLSVKQGGMKYHFLSLRYDLTWDWTPVSRTICEYSSDYDNETVNHIKTEGNWHKRNTIKARGVTVLGVARSVMVIVVGNGHGDTSSNPGLDWLHLA